MQIWYVKGVPEAGALFFTQLQRYAIVKKDEIGKEN